MIANSGRTLASSRLRIFISSFLVVAAGIVVVGANDSPRSIVQHVEPRALSAGKIAPWVIQRTANGQQAEFFVVLADQADLSGAAALATKVEKGRYVYDSLKNKSQATQGPILQWLRQRRIEHRRFYIVNAILVKSTREVAEALAARPDVFRAARNPPIRHNLPP